MVEKHVDGDADRHEPGVPDALRDLLFSMEHMEDFLQQLVEVTVRTLDVDVSAAVTLLRDGRPATVASSAADAAEYDEVQYGFDEGPCLMAMRTQQVVHIDALVDDDRFPDYRLQCMALGLRSVLSLPLDGGAGVVGALNLYSSQPHTFGLQEQAEAVRFAGEASRALSLAVRMAQHTELAQQLQSALSSRTVIDQAMGIIMGQNRCGAERAFAVLREASQHRNVKLRVVAEEIVAALNQRSTEP